jgi:deoxyribodipyrimidine photo-lyase
MESFDRPTTIWWLRRDLRLQDNQALLAALEYSSQVIPVFILDQRLIDSRYSGEKRLAFLFAVLRSLNSDLQERGSRLILRQGNPLDELQKLLDETGASRVFAEPDYSPFAMQRDGEISRHLPVSWTGSPAILPPEFVLKPNGEPYTVFTPFSKAWKMHFPAGGTRPKPPPERISTPGNIYSLSLPLGPSLPKTVPFPATTQEAHRRLERFTNNIHEGVFQYAAGRDRQDLDGTSRISPYLRFGLLSARQAAEAAQQAIRSAADAEARRGAETWLNELIWRDFYIHILYHHPRLRRENFRLPHVRWQNRQDHFQAWSSGQTGYPIVDASMRQLVESGWMHNRSRMIVASFLTKDLLVDWRMGEQFFMQHLIDGDPAANNGGWQWTAGTGTDAAPYFRIFNPVTQGIRHDPQGKYIRRWLPVLESVPDEYIHEPWKMPRDIQVKSHCIIGQDYPPPLVDHAEARQRALIAYGQPV